MSRPEVSMTQDGDWREMDLNPVKVLAPGEGCVVVDARIAVASGVGQASA